MARFPDVNQMPLGQNHRCNFHIYCLEHDLACKAFVSVFIILLAIQTGHSRFANSFFGCVFSESLTILFSVTDPLLKGTVSN